MPAAQCKCGKSMPYLDDMVGILSCPHCGEQLADFGARINARSEPIQPSQSAVTARMPNDTGIKARTGPIQPRQSAVGSDAEAITTRSSLSPEKMPNRQTDDGDDDQ